MAKRKAPGQKNSDSTQPGETNNTQNNMKITPQNATSSSRPDVLAPQNAGIHKKVRHKKKLGRKQNERHEKGMERAMQNLEKMEVKIAKSVGRERSVKERKQGWADVNGSNPKKAKVKAKTKDVQKSEIESLGQDENMEGAEGAVSGNAESSAIDNPESLEQKHAAGADEHVDELL